MNEPESTADKPGTPDHPAAASGTPDHPASASGTPVNPMSEPVLARQNRMRMSLVWIVPMVALVIGAGLVLRTYLQAGPEIEIEFRSAEGIEPARTEVRYKEVVVGRVKRVRLGPDRSKVFVSVALDKSMANIAVDDTRFWVVRPRIGTGGISGLGTLFSGAYIGVDAGASEDGRADFVGLDSPPLVLRGEPGRSYVLRADDLGSLDVGSPIYHRRIRVGRVVGYTFEPDGQALQIQVFVEAPHDKLVTPSSRFWNASGFDIALNAGGLTVNTQSVASVLAGGVAFATPPAAASASAAAVGHRFNLLATQRAALAAEDGEPLRVRMVFKESVRGLDEGAPVDLLGVEIGTVRSIALQNDPQGKDLPVEVQAEIYPKRLGALRDRLFTAGANLDLSDRILVQQFVERGLRAQMRNGNLLTGRLYIALTFDRKAAPTKMDIRAEVPTLPTIPGTLADVQPQLAEIVNRLSKVRFDAIGSGIEGVLKTADATGGSLQSTLASAQDMIKQLTPEAQRTLVDVQRTLADVQRTLADAQLTLGTTQQALKSADRNLLDVQAPLQRSAGQTLAELQRAAQSLRVLADYLQRNPESMLRGKPPDPDLTRSPETPR